VSGEPDPFNADPSVGIAVTFEKDLTGEDVARRWHAVCRQRDLKRRGKDAAPEPASVDWTAAIRNVLAEAEDA
jgi:hypothetical protein